MDLAAQQYLVLTTFRQNGEAKSTPVWIADLGDGTIGFTTQSDSWKCRRIRNDPRITLQPSDARGQPRAGTEPVSGTAVLARGDEFERVRAAITKKYRIAVALIGAYQRIAGHFGRSGASDIAVIITLDE